MNQTYSMIHFVKFAPRSREFEYETVFSAHSEKSAYGRTNSPKLISANIELENRPVFPRGERSICRIESLCQSLRIGAVSNEYLNILCCSGKTGRMICKKVCQRARTFSVIIFAAQY